MDTQYFRNAVVDATKYLAFLQKDVSTFHYSVEVEWGD